MPIPEAFLREFDAEMATTRRLLERIPTGPLDWKPHPKSMSLRQLATHVTELPRWGLRIQGTEWTAGSDVAPKMDRAEQFVARFDENIVLSRAAIAAKSDEELAQEFSVFRDGKQLFKLQKGPLLRRMLLNHLIHHRGQLTVYLRLNDVLLPGVYGPTADEGI